MKASSMRFSPRDIVGLAGFSVVAGIIFAVWSNIVAPIVTVLGGHVGIGIIYGAWFSGGTLVGYVLRKPGAAFLGEIIGGSLVELFLFSPYSILLLYYGPAQGILSELGFALGRYRNWGYKIMMLAGALPALGAYPFDCLVSPFYPACINPGYPLSLHALIQVSMVVSGAVLAGIVVKMVVDAAVASGALRGWAVAQDRKPKT